MPKEKKTEDFFLSFWQEELQKKMFLFHNKRFFR